MDVQGNGEMIGTSVPMVKARPRRTWAAISAATAILVATYVTAAEIVPRIAAGALLHPDRRRVTTRPAAGCADVDFGGAAVTLKGWYCHARGQRRGTVVLLHGVGDNRASVAGAIDRFVAKGFDVVAYDSRAHGESTGDVCTYGYWEKRDLAHVLNDVDAGPIVLLGTSLGAAVALQEAADDRRVIGVVAAEVFSDLRTVARERAPRLLPAAIVRRAFSIAEHRGAFRVDDVSPVAAARRITVPVLLIHGAQDTDTLPDHSRRVLSALAGPKELLLVDGAGHNESLRSPQSWQRIDDFVTRLPR